MLSVGSSHLQRVRILEGERGRHLAQRFEIMSDHVQRPHHLQRETRVEHIAAGIAAVDQIAELDGQPGLNEAQQAIRFVPFGLGEVVEVIGA